MGTNASTFKTLKILFIFTYTLFAFSAFSNKYEINPTINIADAIRNAKAYDTLYLLPGKYLSIQTKVDKALTIIGISYPILDAKEKDDVLWITSDNVHINGLNIQNSARGSMKDYAGIRLERVKNCIIENNQLKHNFFGIYLSQCSDNLIRNNTLSGEGINDAQSGNGIHLWQCNRIVIQHNFVRKHRDGIYFEFARHCRIEHNVSEYNFRYGLHFMFSDNDTYCYNIFRNNGTGVAVMYTKGIRMLNNRFENNWGSSSYGILMKDIGDSYVFNNHFVNNTVGMYMEGSSRIHVGGNAYIRNGWAVKLLANCSQDSFTFNQFYANSFDMSTNGNLVLNYLSHNYWDKYEGYDLNKDKLGDIPYRPVSLFAVLIEQIPLSVMLMRSFTIGLLERAERIIPSLTPDKLIDIQPLMKPNHDRNL